MNQLHRSATYLGISVLAVLAFLSLPHTTAVSIADLTSHTSKIEPVNYFEKMSLQAKAAYVYDISTRKVLYAKNEHDILPLASLTKIMTAVTAVDLVPETTLVTISPESLREEGDSGLYGNERWTLGSLLRYTLVVSSNDGAAAVAQSLGSQAKRNEYQDTNQAFVEKMNSKAEDLGLRTFRFYNPSGLDENKTEAGAYGSARDVAILLEYALKHYQSILEPTRYSSYQISSIDNIVHKAQNTDVLTQKIPGLIAGKTGFSALAGGNLAILFDAGIQHPVAVVVLGSTYDGRFSDVDKLVHASIQTIASGQ